MRSVRNVGVLMLLGRQAQGGNGGGWGESDSQARFNSEEVKTGGRIAGE